MENTWDFPGKRTTGGETISKLQFRDAHLWHLHQHVHPATSPPNQNNQSHMPPPREQSSDYRKGKALPVGKKTDLISALHTKCLIVFQAPGEDETPLLMPQAKIAEIRSGRNQVIKCHVVFVVNWFLLCAFYVGFKPSTNDDCIDYQVKNWKISEKTGTQTCMSFTIHVFTIISRTEDRGTRAHSSTCHDETMRYVLSWIVPGWSPSNLTLVDWKSPKL